MGSASSGPTYPTMPHMSFERSSASVGPAQPGTASTRSSSSTCPRSSTPARSAPRGTGSTSAPSKRSWAGRPTSGWRTRARGRPRSTPTTSTSDRGASPRPATAPRTGSSRSSTGCSRRTGGSLDPRRVDRRPRRGRHAPVPAGRALRHQREQARGRGAGLPGAAVGEHQRRGDRLRHGPDRHGVEPAARCCTDEGEEVLARSPSDHARCQVAADCSWMRSRLARPSISADGSIDETSASPSMRRRPRLGHGRSRGRDT